MLNQIKRSFKIALSIQTVEFASPVCYLLRTHEEHVKLCFNIFFSFDTESCISQAVLGLTMQPRITSKT